MFTCVELFTSIKNEIDEFYKQLLLELTQNETQNKEN